jgi:hypothetical protein
MKPALNVNRIFGEGFGIKGLQKDLLGQIQRNLKMRRWPSTGTAPLRL